MQEDQVVVTIGGVSTTFFSQAHVDAAALAASASAGPTVVSPTDIEVDIMVSDGTMKKFVPAA